MSLIMNTHLVMPQNPNGVGSDHHALPYLGSKAALMKSESDSFYRFFKSRMITIQFVKPFRLLFVLMHGQNQIVL